MGRVLSLLAVGLVAGVHMTPAEAAPDWSRVPARKITVFYTGQASIELLVTKSDHSSANQMLQKGRTCTYCHDEEAPDIGKKIVGGGKALDSKIALEPAPIKGKAAAIPVNVQAAHDGKNLYLRFSWDAPSASSGKKMDADNQVKLAVMLEADKIELGRIGSCWATCHHDMRTMPDANAAAKTHPKAKALGWDDGATKYIKESRTAVSADKSPRGGWDKLKSDAEIAQLLKEGKFLDLMQWRSGKGQRPVDGYILETRHMDGGKSLVKAEGSQSGTTWTVTIERTLAASGTGKHAIEPGKLYSLGFAIHDDWTSARYHHVSLGYQLGLDNPKAEINAVKQ